MAKQPAKQKKERKKPTSKQYKVTGYTILFLFAASAMNGAGIVAAIAGVLVAAPFLVKAKQVAKTE